MSASNAKSRPQFLSQLAGLKQGEQRVVHFYFSAEQRRMLLEQLLCRMGAEDSIILGCSRDAGEFYRSIFTANVSAPQITYIPVTADWHRSVCNLLEECLRQRTGRVVLVTDFDRLVKPAEVEGLAHWLETGLRGSGVASIAQFGGSTFSEHLLRRPVRHSAVLLFDGFYCMPASGAFPCGERASAMAEDPEVGLARD